MTAQFDEVKYAAVLGQYKPRPIHTEQENQHAIEMLESLDANATLTPEQEALADSLISNLGEKVDEGVRAAWDDEIKKRITELDSGKAKTVPWSEVRNRNLAKLPRAH